MDMMDLRRMVMAQMASEMLKKVGSYTFQEDFIGYGNDILPTIMNDSYLSSNALVYVVKFINNTNTSNTKVDAIIFGTKATTVSGIGNPAGYLFRNNYTNIAKGVDNTARLNAGTTADIYRADY